MSEPILPNTIRQRLATRYVGSCLSATVASTLSFALHSSLLHTHLFVAKHLPLHCHSLQLLSVRWEVEENLCLRLFDSDSQPQGMLFFCCHLCCLSLALPIVGGRLGVLSAIAHLLVHAGRQPISRDHRIASNRLASHPRPSAASTTTV